VLPNAASHVLIASIISAPAGVLLARIIIPRDPEAEVAGSLEEGSDKRYDSSIDALIKGTTDGLTIVLSVGATLIVFVALVALVNELLSLLPPVAGSPLSVQRGLGVVFAPLAWCMGIPWREAPAAGSLLGVKLVLTEFTAFINLSQIPAADMSDRTRVIMTYALCGFANIASVGINLAGFSVLVPERRAEITGMVWRAMAAGFLATVMTGSVVGVMPTSLFGHETPPIAAQVRNPPPAAPPATAAVRNPPATTNAAP
jgi:CNT family concentrative nucleoside transporter